MKGFLLKITLLEDRFILILFRLIKFGLIRTSKRGLSGFSIVFGIHKIELQINLSKVKPIKIKYGKHEAGKT